MRSAPRLLATACVLASSAAALVTKRAGPSSVADAFAALESINANASLDTLVGDLVSAGLTVASLSDVEDYVSGLHDGYDGHDNNNTLEPAAPIYPYAADGDAPYDVDEATLRAAIYIPSDFQYGAAGAPPPVILCGGTGNPGYVSFAGSWIPLLNGSSLGDPIWLNVPGDLLGDYQTNAEYVAYAVNYISGISGGVPVAVIGYSQGNLDAQWAYKYWPSTRALVSDHIAISPGYRGTQLTDILLGIVPLPAGWLQAEWQSDFVRALLADDGDSAYVPTTVIYSATDEVVQPQTGANASSHLNDVRGVGATNAVVQDVCSGAIAGGYYGHEMIMFHPLTYALAQDALTHDGPGLVSRIDVESVCASYMAPGLGLEDLLLTENSLVYALATLLLDPDKSLTEPAIKSYAQ